MMDSGLTGIPFSKGTEAMNKAILFTVMKKLNVMKKFTPLN